MAREVKIVVKNVYAPTEQQQFIVAETALVRELKLLVHAQFPGAPLPAHQKLIFGGKVCADSDALLTILSVVRPASLSPCKCASLIRADYSLFFFTMQNQMRSDERAEDAAAVVFHLLVSGTPPRSRPSTPPVTTTTAAPVASSTSVAAVASAAQEAIDSPRPVAPAFSFDGPAGAVGAREPPPPQSAAAFAFPGFNAPFASPSTPVPVQRPVTVPGPGTSPLPQDLLTQGVLMHQQAMLLAQIQYLQYLRAHAQQTQTQTHTQTPPAAQAPPVAPHHPYAHQFGYLGMHHHAHMLHAMHGLQQHQHNGHHGHAAAPAGVVEPPAAPPQRVPLVGQIAREILPLFDLRLAMKMAFMLFIIGQDTPNDRVLMLAFLSFVSYLYVASEQEDSGLD